MCRLAFTRRLRGRRTIRSFGAHPAEGGSFPIAAAVMSAPIMAKSPSSSSQMSGQPRQPEHGNPLDCGSLPNLRRNINAFRFWFRYAFKARFVCYESVAIYSTRPLTVKLAFSSMARKNKIANIVGKEIQKHRYRLGLTQEQFAGQCQLHGLDISRGTVSQIEARLRCVNDYEIMLLADALGVSINSLFPPLPKRPKRGRKK